MLRRLRPAMSPRILGFVLAGGVGLTSAGAVYVGAPESQPAAAAKSTHTAAVATRSFVASAAGPADVRAPLARAWTNGARAQARPSGVGVSRLGARLHVAAAGVTGRWTSHRSGATRPAPFGKEAVVFGRDVTEEYLTVDRRVGARTWRWNLDTGGTTPRVGSDGAVSFRADGRLGTLAILPAKIFDLRGRDVTPRGTRWTVTPTRGSWTLGLRLDDSKLPVPYVIDPAVTHRDSLATTNGTAGATSITLNMPVGVAPRDLLVAQVAVRGGTDVTVTPPPGWTSAVDDTDGTLLRQSTYYRIAGAGEPTTATFTFGGAAPLQQAVGGISALYGLKTTSVVDTFAAGASKGTSASAVASAITTTAPGSLIVAEYAAAIGTAFSTPSGMSERYDAQSSGTGFAARASAGSYTATQVAAGSTGNKTSALTSGHWLAHLLSFRVDDVPPTVTMTDPGANVRGTITFAASPSDADSGVARVQFQRAVAGSGTWVNAGTAVTAAPYTRAFATTGLADGLYDFRAVVTDNASNTANSTVFANVRVDNTLPATATTFPAATSYNLAAWATGCPTQGLCGTVSDGGSGLGLVDLSLRRSTGGLYWDGTAFASTLELFTPVAVSAGSWSLAFPGTSFPATGSYVAKLRATDAAGNVATLSRTFTFDNTAPNTTITSPPLTGGANSTTQAFAFTSTESGSRFECQLDGSAFAPCTSPTTYTGLSVSTHTFAVRAIDPSGNADPTPASYTWRIDLTAPTATLTAPAAGATLSLTTTLSATASDDVGVVGVQFKLDGANLGSEDKTAPYTLSWNTRTATSGPHTVSAVARDLGGNTTTSQAAITVDNDGVIGPGLQAAYAFDEGAGTTAADGSNRGKTGTLVGARWAAGKHGSAAFFDGINDRVELPSLGTFYRTAFTFEAWVQKRGSRTDVSVMGSWNGDGPMIWVDPATGRYTLTIGSSDTNKLDSGRSPAIGQWQHLAATWDGTTLRFYVDGVLTASKAFAGDAGTTDRWRIGDFSLWDEPIGFFDGLIDDVRIYNRALPATELVGDMSSSVGPPDHTAPTTPTGLALVSSTTSSVKVKWNASTDNLRLAGYRVYRDGTLVTTTTALSATVGGLSCGQTTTIGVEAYDVSGNTSARATFNTSTAACDTSPPTLALTAPAVGAVVGGTVTLRATASDDRGVAGVQFKVDGANVGSEDTTAPYSASWNTRLATHGAHTVSAVARDTSGNTSTSQAGVQVDNSGEPGPGLVASYGFDEGSGTSANDGSGDTHTATLVGGAGWGAGEHGSAVSLDGNDDRVDLPALGTFYRTAFTYEAWVNKASSKKDVAIVGTWDGSGPMIWVDHLSGHYRLTLGSDIANYLDSGQAPVPGEWHHVAATFAAGTARFYIDGTQVASSTFTGDVGSSNVWRVGAYRSSPTGNFDGRIDDVRVYNRALPAAEIAADMTTPASPDVYPPSVDSLTPEDGASGVASGATVRATFSEAIDPSTLTGTTFRLRDASNAVVPASVAYDAATRTATLTPADALARGASYTATLAGGTGGIEDLGGNPLRANVATQFATKPAPQPILLVESTTNNFSGYTQEILETEGITEYETLDVSQLSTSALDGYDTVILGDLPVSATQAAALETWVQAGGDLIALHPDKRLASLLGLTDLSATLSNAYLKVDTSQAPGTGIVGDTMQFHGTADLYSLAAGARAVATLYSDAATATASPAVTIRDVGTAGGHAAAFTFDLARSIVYTRQGNPAWAGQERDGVVGIRPDDLFYGNAAGDPQPDWVNVGNLPIPQADEQQRLLANLVTLLSSDRKPIPRFWYFPHDFKAAIVMTGDDHAVGGTAGRFDQNIAASPPDCSVVDWECVRSTSYVYSNGPLTDTQAKAYTDAGFEVALHTAISNGCGSWTFDGANTIFTTQLGAFGAKYPSIPAPATNRTHCVTWDDWATEPKVELLHGVRLDTNYYAYPGSWIGSTPGFMTGSGIPMRFADTDGSTIGVYQAMTQMDDEASQPYPATANALLDNALGPQGYYGFFTVNMHTDQAVSAGADAIIASAQARGVPVISSRQLLDWLDARRDSSIGGLSWSGNTLSFTVDASADANGLQAMLPLSAHGGTLTALTRGGGPVSFATKTIKGVAYAFFAADDGSYAAVYG